MSENETTPTYPQAGDRVRITVDVYGNEACPQIGAEGVVTLNHAADGDPDRIWVKVDGMGDHPFSLGHGWPYMAEEVEILPAEAAE